MFAVALYGNSMQSFHVSFLCFISSVEAWKELVTEDSKKLNLIGEEEGEGEQMENEGRKARH